ncbi:fucose mutarotase isoform X2 [Xyrauchen texanus]|uniref:fucose mutarotase isoform X2 n=1 Tax=Xyrauchen texanus TaxID=154827 RepID=UPI002241DC6C|nr:fucose mutarotase isoform X2 [Xyrauchen texanus]
MVMLKGIPSILTPQLLYVLAQMGHGDELGVSIPELLQAILKLFPLDTYDDSAAVMDLVQSDKLKGLKVPVWDQYSELLKQAGSDGSFKLVERFAFYERAKNAFAVVATGETALYGNLIIKKGVITSGEQC